MHGKMKCMDCGGEMYAEGGEVDDESTEPQPMAVSGANNKAAEMTKSMRSAFNYDKDYAEGGFVKEEEASGYHGMPEEPYHYGDDMVRDIMMSRAKGYSMGGKVANDDSPDVDSKPAEYDDLVKDDNLEFHDTEANSGDDLGNEEHDREDRDDIDEIMASRKKKGRMPVPA